MKNFIIAIAILLTACSKKSQHVKLQILGTSDVHGAVYPFDLIERKPAATSLAQVYSYVTELRQQKDLGVILLDNGDILQGSPMVYYSNFEDTISEHICADVMNYMGYDAATVGNHDIEPGHAVYDKLKHEFNFPWLAANAIDTRTNKPYFQPYTIIHKQGIKVAVIGLITPAIPLWLPENIWKGIRFEAMVPAAKKWIKIVQEKEHPDFIIGLFHSGVGEDNATNSPIIENASKLVAKTVADFDMIICGHDHQKKLEWVENTAKQKVLIINPKSKSNYLASVMVDFKWNQKHKTYDKQLLPQLIDVSQLPVSKVYTEHFQNRFNTVKNYVSKQIGIFTKPITAMPALWGDSPFMDIIHNVQLDITNADISFAAPLSLSASIDSGRLYVSDLFKLYKYENLIYTLKLTGKEIKDYLEFSYKNWYQQMRQPSDNLLFIKKSKDKNSLTTFLFNYDSAEGINYTVDVSKPYGNRIKIISLNNGKLFSSDSTYTVALNSYRGNGGGDHLTKGAGLTPQQIQKRIIASTDTDFRYYLMKWIEKKRTLIPTCNNNWKAIPYKWVNNAKKRENKLLFTTK